MDTKHVDNIIKNKIESIDDLPDGYEPDLDSKWETIRIGIHQPKRKRLLPLLVASYTTVAILLSIYFINKSNLETNPGIQEQFTEKTIFIEKKHSINNKPTQRKMLKYEKQDNVETRAIISDPLSGLSQISYEEKQPESFDSLPMPLLAIEKKKNRYVVIDFGTDEIDEIQPNHNTASQSDYKFKLGNSDYLSNLNEMHNNNRSGATISLSFVSK
jgi:hypothetical protein